MSKPWVVLKFGGTSVATVKTWGQICARVRELTPSHRVWLCVSALSGVTNALLRAIDEALAPALSPEARFKSYNWIVDAHNKLSSDMGLSADEFAPVSGMLADVKRLLDGVLLTQEVSPRLRARIAAYGELLSSQLGLPFLRRAGLNAIRVDSRSLLTSDVDDGKTLTEADMYLEADVRPSTQIDRANAAAQGADVVICQGFIASTPSGATCLLGRGGSDTSGALFGALVGAQRVEIWTDVNGMFTADPRFVPRARLIRSLTYREAQELAAMGAKVLHPRCLLPAAHAGIPVEVRNTMDPSDDAEITVVSATGLDYLTMRSKAGATANGDAPSSGLLRIASGTELDSSSSDAPVRAAAPASPAASRIVYASSPHHGEAGRDTSPAAFLLGLGSPRPDAAATGTEAKVLAVARRKGVTLMTLATFNMWGASGFLSKVFAPFAAHGVSVDLIATSQYAVSLTLDHIPEGVEGETFRRLCSALSKICSTTVRYPCAVVSVVGRSLRNALPQLGRAMKTLEGVPVHMVSEATEDLNLSFVVDEEYADRLVAALHVELLESDAVAKDPQFGPVWTEMPCGKPA